ncbi:MAG: penicillin-insensitive murein endopeptidase [Gaiella sp.]
MGWQVDEVWLDADVGWFREAAGAAAPSVALQPPAFVTFAPGSTSAVAVPPGLAESRRRRAARKKRQSTTRTVSAAALVIGSAAMLPLAGQRDAHSSRPRALQEDPPSQTVRIGPDGIELTSLPPTAALLGAGLAGGDALAAGPAGRSRAESFPEIVWHKATSRGLQYAGSLSGGTQLPIEGRDWVTWNPVADSVPNKPHRLYGHERTIRTLVSVISAYREANPGAPRVVVGDISFRDGGAMDQHVSHQNGLDVDVYYPRVDGWLRAPRAPAHVDRVLTQDLLDRFLAAGARVVFVGYSTGLRGPGGVVVPYPHHENHMHVRFPAPG